MAIFYTGNMIASAFAGLVAAGVFAGLDGAHGLAGWRWYVDMLPVSFFGQITTDSFDFQALHNSGYPLHWRCMPLLLPAPRSSTADSLAQRSRKTASTQAHCRRHHTARGSHQRVDRSASGPG